MHRPVVVSLDDGMLTISNRRSFTDLADLRATWELLVEGAIADSGELDVGDVAASSTVRLDLPCRIPDAADAHFTIRWSQRRATAWAPKAHLVAWDQFPLPSAHPETHPSPHPGNRGAPADAVFAQGVGPELVVFRAPVDNDGFKLLADLGEGFGVGAKTLARWRDAGVDRRPADELVEHRHVVETLDDGSQVHTHEVIVPPTSTISPGSASRSSCGPASTASAGTGAGRWRTTRTAIVGPSSASGRRASTNRRTSSRRSSVCAPTADGSSSSPTARRCDSTCSSRP